MAHPEKPRTPRQRTISVQTTIGDGSTKESSQKSSENEEQGNKNQIKLNHDLEFYIELNHDLEPTEVGVIKGKKFEFVFSL